MRFGLETLEELKDAVGSTLLSIKISEFDVIELKVSETDVICILDDSDCCEKRYFSTDDDLAEYTGATLLGFEVKDGTVTHDEEEGTREIQFLELKTSKGPITFACYNEHNGYYSGFNLYSERIKDEER